MNWGLVLSLLVPYVAATLPPYKRFVSPFVYSPDIAWKFNWFAVGTPTGRYQLGSLSRLNQR